MVGWSVEFLLGVLDASPESIVVCEARAPDYPLIYANSAFAKLTGYEPEELRGQNLRKLQAWDREQDGRTRVRAALEKGESCRALLRNYRKDGTQFWNEMLIQPLRLGVADNAEAPISHFVGFLHDVSERERSALRRAPSFGNRQREDRLSGLCSRSYFEELLEHDWQVGLRERRMLTVLAFDISELGGYNDTFGRAAGDACIRRVAGVIGACFRRGSDVVARWEGGCIVAMIRNSDPGTVRAFAASVAQRVYDQHIHHPHAQRLKYVSVCVGAANLEPAPNRSPQSLVEAALSALQRAKQQPTGEVAVVGAVEMG
jgi:diguanylate cyclase (GGDEF)-like protein/PAS domain S-box-containing protein